MSYYDRRDSTPLDCKVYVGNLGSGASRNELEKEFAYFGPLTNVWVARNPPGFAYIEFEDSRDAKDAVRNLDGEMLCGRRAKVELSHGKQRNKSFRSSYGERPQRRPNMSDIRCYSCNDYGHYSRDCQRDRRSRSRSRSPRRRRKSRSESRDRSHSKSHSKSRSRSRSFEKGNRSRSPEKRERSRSRSRSSKRKSRSKSSEVNRSYSHSRSRSSSR